MKEVHVLNKYIDFIILNSGPPEIFQILYLHIIPREAMFPPVDVQKLVILMVSRPKKIRLSLNI